MVAGPSTNVNYFEKPVVFEDREAYTFGVGGSEMSGYVVPIGFPPDGPNTALLDSIARKNGVTPSLSEGYFDERYSAQRPDAATFSCDWLTQSQEYELLNRGTAIVHIKFKVVGTHRRADGSSGLVLDLIKLRKVRDVSLYDLCGRGPPED